eukprot:COSAG03_NODE_3932_length_1754_cov_1.367372_1_plen_252_part_00
MPRRYANREGASSCQSCASGRYEDGYRTACIDCQAGRIASADESSSCERCPIGRFAALSASTQCQSCASGRSECYQGAANCSITCASLHHSGMCDAGITPESACGSTIGGFSGAIAFLAVVVVAIALVVIVGCCKNLATIRTDTSSSPAQQILPTTSVNPVATDAIAIEVAQPASVPAVRPVSSAPVHAISASQPHVVTLDDFLAQAVVVEFRGALTYAAVSATLPAQHRPRLTTFHCCAACSSVSLACLR